MFDFFGSASSLRRTREMLEDFKAPDQGLWTYPVVSEKCGCGAYTETVLIDTESASNHFSDWRRTHGCTLRKNHTV